MDKAFLFLGCAYFITQIIYTAFAIFRDYGLMLNSDEGLELYKKQNNNLDVMYDRLNRNDQTVQGIIMKLADFSVDIENLQKKKSLAKNKST